MIRHIEAKDYFKGYLDLINVFTREPMHKSYDEFKDALEKVYSQNSEIFVIEKDNKIISSIHLLYEYKLHNNFRPVCHVEDVVTHPDYRKNGHASALLKYATIKASEKGCYKIVLTSNENNTTFYTNNDFIIKGCELCKYL